MVCPERGKRESVVAVVKVRRKNDVFNVFCFFFFCSLLTLSLFFSLSSILVTKWNTQGVHQFTKALGSQGDIGLGGTNYEAGTKHLKAGNVVVGGSDDVEPNHIYVLSMSVSDDLSTADQKKRSTHSGHASNSVVIISVVTLGFCTKR